MVRNYVRKTDRGNYPRALLLDLVAKIRAKELTISTAAARYRIPKTTLYGYVKGKRGIPHSLGKPLAISQHHEKLLAANLQELDENGFHFTQKEKSELVGLYLRSHNIKTPFKRSVPGEWWWTSFRKRHGLPTKSLIVDFGRPKERDVIVVKEYYSTIESKINELSLADKPGQIWHIEEHSFCGGKRVDNEDKKKDITVVTALSAKGKKAPLLTVAKGEESRQWQLGKQLNVSNNLGMCRDVFKDYFTTIFLNYIDDSLPSLVIYHGQNSHIDIDLINDARKAKISLIKSPPYLEDLGISVANILKQKWDIEKSSTPEEFITFVADTFDVLEVLDIEEGFRSAGVHPFEAVCDSKLDIESLMVYEEFHEYKMNNTVRDVPEQIIMTEDQEFQMSLKMEPEDYSTSFDFDVGSIYEPEEENVQMYNSELKQAMITVKKGLTCIEICSDSESVLAERQNHVAHIGVQKLTIEQENQIVIWVADLSDAGFIVTEKYLADAVNNLITDFGRIPLKSKDGHKRFLKKHPELADRVTQETAELTEDAMKISIERVQTYIKERKLEDILNDPRRILNCGETTLLTPVENQAVNNEIPKINAKDLTVVVTASADGNIQAPSIFFNYKATGLNNKSVVNWTKGDFLCDQIIDVLHPWLTDHDIALPVILFVDCTTHINLNLLNFCQENEIILIALPDYLQPLESVFRPLKRYWEEDQCDIQKLKKDDLAKELENRINKDFSGISNGFKMCGLYPFDLKIGLDIIGQKTQKAKSSLMAL